MADDGQSAFAEPMTMQEALAKFDSAMSAKEDEAKEPAPEPEPEAEEAEDAEAQAEAEEADDAEKVTEPEPEQDDDGPQILSVDEYGDVLVDVNGEATSLSDLVSGNLRQADYSRKTQSLSEQRKSLEAELVEKEKALEAREQQLNEQLSQLEGEPDWIKLAEEDPLGYVEQKAKWEAKRAKADKARAELEAKQQKAVREFAKMTAEKAVEVFPEWKDTKAFDGTADARKNAALSAGFTEAEYSQAYDFRLAVVLEKAARYDAMPEAALDATSDPAPEPDPCSG